MPTRERMPEWMVALFAVLYAAVGSGFLAAGAISVCEDPSRQTAGRFCAEFVRGWHWAVLVLVPTLLAVFVVRHFPAQGPARRYAWITIAIGDMVLVSLGLGWASAPQ